MSYPAYDQWGQIQVPTTTAPVFTPQFPSWGPLQYIPSSDFTLAVILDWIATWLVTDAQVLAAWRDIGGDAGDSPLKTVYLHDPAKAVFEAGRAPALFLFRTSSTQEYIADDWLRDTSKVTGLWVFPLQTQVKARVRAPFVNALAKLMGAGIERGRTPGWVQPGDTDPDATTQGSLFYPYSNFDYFELKGWNWSELRIEAPDGLVLPPLAAVQFNFELAEKLDYGLGRFPVLNGASASIYLATPATTTTWSATTTYVGGSCVVPPTLNGYFYAAISGGISGATAPTWSTTPGATFSDGTVTWQCVGLTPVLADAGPLD